MGDLTQNSPNQLDNWLLSFVGFAVSLFIFLPLVVYVTNLDDVDTSKELILTYGILSSVATVAALSFFSLFKRIRFFLVFIAQVSVLVIFVFSIYPNAPGELAGIEYGRYSEIDILAFVKLVILLLLVILGARRYPKQFHDIAMVISTLVVASSVGLGVFANSLADKERREGIEIKKAFLELGTRSNVIVLLLDSFTGFRMVEIFDERPDLKENFEGFTLYPKAIAPALNTPAGSSIVLTGDMEYALNEVEEGLRNSKSLENSFMADAKHLGFETAYISVLEVDNKQIPSHNERAFFVSQASENKQGSRAYFEFLTISLARVVPKHISDYLGTLSNRIFQDPNAMETELEVLNRLSNPAISRPLRSKLAFEYFVDGLYVGHKEKKAIYFLSKMSHPEWNFTESGQFKLKAGWQSSSIFVVNEVSRFLKKLKALDSYDNSLLIIASDHGLMPVKDRAFKFPSEFNPLIMVKPIAANDEVKISDMTVWLGDVASTVRDHLGLDQKTKIKYPTRSLLQPEDLTRRINVPLFFKQPYISYHGPLRDWARVDGGGKFEDYQAMANSDIDTMLEGPGVISLNIKPNEFRSDLVKRNWISGEVSQYSVFLQFNNRTLGNRNNSGLVVLSDSGSVFSVKKFADPVQGFEYFTNLETSKNVFVAGLAVPGSLIETYFPESSAEVSLKKRLNFVYTKNELGSPGHVLNVTSENITQIVDWPGKRDK